LLLVLLVFAAVAAIAWPSVRRQFENYRLRVAADMVRTEWCLARIEAMRSGCVCTFRHSLGGNQFRTQRAGEGFATSGSAPSSGPSSAPAWSASSPAAAVAPSPSTPASPPPAGTTATPTSPPAAGATAASAAAPAGDKLLPEGVDFMLQETAPDPGAAAEAEVAAGPPDTAPPDWSQPIFFYPDGTTSDAQLTLRNGQGRAIELNLRGLTGTVDVGDILSVEE
jgi:hypothetical protein